MTAVSQTVVDMANQLALAVNTTLDPKVPHHVRIEAYNLLEKAKEDLVVSVECGFFMSSTTKEPPVRHFGLQLLEHAIKYKWNDLTVDQKDYIKENAIKLVLEGTLDLLHEHIFVKDKVSRLIVEMIKREWPQQWPNLVSGLRHIGDKGPTQTELILFVFLRLAEDVVTLQNLECNHRRRDLYQALAADMDAIFSLLLSYMDNNKNHYAQMMKEGKEHIAQQHCRAVQVSLMTLAGYVGWVAAHHVFDNDGLLLNYLCVFLSHDYCNLEAAECLLQIVSRKGKPEERRPILILFDDNHMSAIFEAAIRAVQSPLSESSYRFLKVLTQVLTALGHQICCLWGKEPDLSEPSNIGTYLKVILTFTEHPSLSIYSYTTVLWGQIFRHEHFSKSDVLLSIIPAWIAITTRKIVKHGYPSKNDSESCQFSRFDFDCDEDYSHFFYKVRSESLEVIKLASALDPITIFTYIEGLLTQQILKPIDPGPNAEKQLCNLLSPSFLEWDALSQIVESAMNRVMQQQKHKQPDAERGVKLLQQCLMYETVDPLILSALLSCISGLFVFVRIVPSLLMDVLNKIFSALTFSLPGQTKDSRSRAVKNVRRHACSLLVKISRGYPDILINAFDFINNVMENLSHNPTELSQMEKVTLGESLLLISNHNCSFEKQSSFIGKLLKPVSDFWLNIKQQFSSPREFMSFVGLDKAPVEPSDKDVNGQNRAQIIYSINLMMAIIKRSEYPSDLSQAERGGFILCYSDNGNVVCRNPATPYFLPLLHQLFCLLRLFNGLWHPTALTAVSQGYSKAYNLPESEKNNILGLTCVSPTDPYSDLPKVQHPLERMQYFLSIVHDNCYHILGNAGMSLGLQFYQHPHLAEYIIHSSLSNLHFIPEYRLRPIIRTFLKPFIQSCPPECYRAVLLPILNHFCPYMLERLSSRWDHLNNMAEIDPQEEENKDVQEILEDLLIRMLTREYVDLLKALLINGQKGTLTDGPEMMDADMEVPVPVNSNVEMSDLGELVLGCDAICQAVVSTLLKVLWWQDSVACLKAVGVVTPALKWLSNERQFLSPEAVNQVLFAVLQGLHRHGQHEANQSSLLSLGLAVYEMFLPQFPTIREVILSLPGVPAVNVQKLDEKILNPHPNIKAAKAEKDKKDCFKKLVNEVVGRNVGEAFKKEVHIKSLPPIFSVPRPKQPSIVETDSDIGLTSLFGSDSNGHMSMGSHL
ncbi:Exportin-5 [Halocaridina rubra]|uniref:Exportin-5 n=1 Tax=Halocaridina rubra TaxID=373956 RepID=A0AAN8X3W7_HALRR